MCTSSNSCFSPIIRRVVSFRTAAGPMLVLWANKWVTSRESEGLVAEQYGDAGFVTADYFSCFRGALGPGRAALLLERSHSVGLGLWGGWAKAGAHGISMTTVLRPMEQMSRCSCLPVNT